MLEIVFNESVSGALKTAKNLHLRNSGGVVAAFIGSEMTEEEKKKLLEEFQKKRMEGKRIEGTSQDVISLPLELDVGDISEEILGDNRKELLFDSNRNPFISEEANTKGLEDFWKAVMLNYGRLEEGIKTGGDIRIWWSDAAYSACGFYHIISVLKDCKGKVLAVKLPRYSIGEDGAADVHTSWTEVEAEKFYRFLPFEKEISESERYRIAAEWDRLKKQNAPLRAMINGNLTSVREDFYDDFLEEAVPDGEFTIGKLIAKVMESSPLGVSDRWYIKRIQDMINKKKLVVVKDNPYVYGKVLMKPEVQLMLYDRLEDESKLVFVDIAARYRGSWVLSKARGRTTWECPGGHIEKGETPKQAAARELWEETGAGVFDLIPIGYYGVKGNDGILSSESEVFGAIFYAEIKELEPLPDFEMEGIAFFQKLPDNWTYPYAHPLFLELAEKSL